MQINQKKNNYQIEISILNTVAGILQATVHTILFSPESSNILSLIRCTNVI